LSPPSRPISYDHWRHSGPAAKLYGLPDKSGNDAASPPKPLGMSLAKGSAVIFKPPRENQR
jgi:hypothetical protein